MQTEWQKYNMYLKIHHKVRIWDDIIEYRLETEGQQQKAALEAGEAAKAQLEAKLKKKEEEVLTLFILVIIITRALHSPCSSCLCLSPSRSHRWRSSSPSLSRSSPPWRGRRSREPSWPSWSSSPSGPWWSFHQSGAPYSAEWWCRRNLQLSNFQCKYIQCTTMYTLVLIQCLMKHDLLSWLKKTLPESHKHTYNRTLYSLLEGVVFVWGLIFVHGPESCARFCSFRSSYRCVPGHKYVQKSTKLPYLT